MALSDDVLEKILQLFEARAQQVNAYYLRKIGEHMQRLKTLPPSDVNRLIEMKRMNANIRDVERRIARMCEIDERDVAKVLKATAQSDYRFMSKYYGGRAQIPWKENDALKRVLEAQYRQTRAAISNLSNTTVVSQAYRQCVDAGIQAAQSGTEDYGAAIRRALRNAGQLGLMTRPNGTRAVVYSSGHTRRLDSAVRQNILDGVRQLNQHVMAQIGEEIGANGVEIDAHMLCAEDHLPYQGGQYTDAEFQDIQDGLQRPFGEWNCRHTWHPIVVGIAPPRYTRDQIDEMNRYSTEKIEIDGREKTRYEWTQEMRRQETQVRRMKDTAILAQAAGDGALERQCRSGIERTQNEYERMCQRAGLKPDWTRMHVWGYEDDKSDTSQRPNDDSERPSANGGNKQSGLATGFSNPKASIKSGADKALEMIQRHTGEWSTDELISLGHIINTDIRAERDRAEQDYQQEKKNIAEGEKEFREAKAKLAEEIFDALMTGDKEKTEKLKEENKELEKDGKWLEKHKAETEAKWLKDKSEAAIKILKRIRPFGGVTKDNFLEKIKNSNGNNKLDDLLHMMIDNKTRDAVIDGMNCYPTEWIERSRGNPITLHPVWATGRAHYNHSSGEVLVNGEKRTSVHELAHRMEHVIMPLLKAEHQYYDRRTAGCQLEQLQKYYERCEPSEYTRKDNFIDAYMGRDYNGSAYELCSMGFEKVFTDWEDIAKDEEMLDWLIGIISAL